MFVLVIEILLTLIYGVATNIKVLDSGLLNFERNSVALQFFVDIENENRTNHCVVYAWCKQCCLPDPESSETNNCGIMEGSETNMDTIPPADRHTMTFVYPTITLYNRIGFCDFVIDYICHPNKRTRRRYEVNIPFNTRLTKSGPDVKVCSTIDQDPLYYCRPVNCDWKYDGSKPFFDRKTQRCIQAPECTSIDNTELPAVAYVPRSNICRNLNRAFSLEEANTLEVASPSPTREKRRRSKPAAFYSKIIERLNNFTSSINTKRGLFASRGSLIDHLDALTLLSAFAVSGTVILLVICFIHAVCGARHRWQSNEMFKYLRKRTRDSHDVHKETDKLLDEKRRFKEALVKDVITRNIPEVRSSVIKAFDACKRQRRSSFTKYVYSDTSLDGVGLPVFATSSTSSLDDDDDDE